MTMDGRSRAAALFGLMILTLAVTCAGAAAAPVTLTVWVSPSGSDDNDGLSADTPFLTLQHTSDWLCGGRTTCTGRGQPVEIRLAQQTFPLAGVTRTSFRYNPGDAPAFTASVSIAWHYFDPDFTTTFEPWAYQPGDGWAQVSAGGGYPTFDGSFSLDTGFVFTPLTTMAERSTGLQFLYTRWQHFNVGAITLSGGLSTEVTDAGITVYTETSRTANGVLFYGNYFTDIGNTWNPTHHLGYGAVLPNNSSNDIYRNNHFVRLINTTQRDDIIHIHGIYGAHGSSNALVEGNEFTDVSGDAVRQRDRTHGTMVRLNTFTRAGAFAYFDDYYCRPNTPVSYCTPKEYRSYRGVFTQNTRRGTYPQGITGRRPVYCHDQPAGLCPSDRIAVT